MTCICMTDLVSIHYDWDFIAHFQTVNKLLCFMNYFFKIRRLFKICHVFWLFSTLQMVLDKWIRRNVSVKLDENCFYP